MSKKYASTPIPVRRMDFEFHDLARYWHPDGAWVTHFLHSLSAVFPDGERFFMDSVRNYEKQITDPELRQQIRGFIGQEANHGKEHEGFNNAVTQQHGFRVDHLVNFTKHGLRMVQKVLPKRLQLSMTAGFEHFTAILAHQLLQNPETVAEVGGVYADMFMWHAVEETEHKAVAYDVYQTVDGRYWLRMGGMLISTSLFLVAIPTMMLYLLAQDKKLGDVRGALAWIKFLTIKPGLYTRIIPEYLDYYRPGFHPWMHDNRELVAERIKDLKRFEVKRRVA